jgi:hypothetical protein
VRAEIDRWSIHIPAGRDGERLRQVASKAGIQFANYDGATDLQINRMQGIEISEDDYFVLCCTQSENLSLRTMERCALIKINDVERFASILQGNHSLLLGSSSVGSVRYEARDYDPRMTTLTPHPFIKRPQFKHEQEIRIIWKAKTKHASLMIDCPEAGRLIERIY